MNFLVTSLQKFPVLTLLIFGACFVAFGDLAAKYWSLHTRSTLYVLAVLFYAVSPIFYMPTLLKEGLAVTTVIWSVLITLVSILIGVVIFKESLNLVQVLGIALGIVAVVILSLGQ